MAEFNMQDSEFEESTTQYINEAERIGELVEKYINVLKSIVENKMLEGDSGVALLDFSALVEGYIKNELASIFGRYKTKADAFVNDAVTEDEANLGQ